MFDGQVKHLAEMGEIAYEHLFVDGTKIEANANKRSFVWQKSSTKYESRVIEKLKKRVPELCCKYGILHQDAEELLQ